jgi:hypothetical protein
MKDKNVKHVTLREGQQWEEEKKIRKVNVVDVLSIQM